MGFLGYKFLPSSDIIHYMFFIVAKLTLHKTTIPSYMYLYIVSQYTAHPTLAIPLCLSIPPQSYLSYIHNHQTKKKERDRSTIVTYRHAFSRGK